MRKITDSILGDTSPLSRIVQKDRFIGWVYSVDYETALVLTNDLFKNKARGIPHNCFLTAATFDPDRMSDADDEELEVVLLRVVGSASLPQSTDDIKTKISHLRRQEDPDEEIPYDHLTLGKLQFHGLECRVLGTFYLKDGELWLGSDIESFYAAVHLNVYRPSGKALEQIVNHLDPSQRQILEDTARSLDLTKPIAPIRIGTVRYTSTDRLHRGTDEEEVPVYIQPADFLARRTALFGMTRTGKSNANKQIVSVVKRVSDEGGLPIGQLIYDVNGEYANPNQQDRSALSEVYPSGEVVRYRMVDTEGFQPLQNNFYSQLTEGHRIIRGVLREEGSLGQADANIFVEASFDEPPGPRQSGEWYRWQRRVAVYQALLFQADFSAPSDLRITFAANQDVRDAVNSRMGRELDPSQGLSPRDAVEWWETVAQLAREGALPSSSSGNPWMGQVTRAMANMLSSQNSQGNFINGYRVLAPAKKYHSPRRSQEVSAEIYAHLTAGRIVILDLSLGDLRIRERISEEIARHVLNSSMKEFVEGRRPPEIMIYIEEAHNLIGRDADLDETWPKIAKEGAKYRIGLVFATQEVSSMHPNILANTENWIITHLNNQKEVRTLGAFYDFDDFSRSLMRAQDVGFARVKTLSGPFVVPVQVDKFDPEQERRRAVTVRGATASASEETQEVEERPIEEGSEKIAGEASTPTSD